MTTIFYIGWIGFGNVGDDLMWDVFRDNANLMQDVQSYKLVPSMPGVDLKEVGSYDIIVLGGGSLLIPGYVDVLYNAMKQGKRIAIWGSGTDWLEKGDMLALMAYPSSSIRHTPPPEHVAMLKLLFKNAVFAGVRGPLTKRLLMHLGIDAKRITQAGDPGLLLMPDSLPPPKHTCMWDDNDKIIGVNWGTSYNRIYGQQEIAVEDQLAETARQWALSGYKIYLYYLWGPDKESILRLYEKIGMPDHVRIAPRVYTQQIMMRILRRCSFTVNFKLHASVLSAAVEVPFVALGYRLKTYDFAESLDLTDYVVATDVNNIKEKLLDTAQYAERSREPFIRKLRMHTHTYREQLRKPFYEMWQ